ncbi:Scarecrow-like protein 23 [Dichanthelium oligosanthes]|uniref:Scarecrow-like protein 23 n=1 Tax=Dichanthelium oligosanthes TaxID=888268 RepID=A0A1E5VCV6_9POAL|nr:Scarecrow-like protein 23 [Dichanthelium oligosanthes]
MNLTLSLAINGGGTGTGKKRKVLDDDVGDGGDNCGRVMRLLQARERMMARLELDDSRRVAPDDDGGSGGLRLMHLLLTSVAAGESGDVHAAAAALHEVYRRASFGGGDPAQRVAAYFADALASRLLRSPVAAASPPTPTRGVEFLAYTMFYQASPLYQFAHFTANQAIVEAFEGGGRRSLHVVDFDVSYGFQWPSLIQSLSDAAAAATSTSGGAHDGDDYCKEPVSLRITGLGTSADELRQTEARLTRFASGCPNVRFEFEGVVDGPINSCRHERIKTDDNATVVVNLVFPAAQSSRTSTREQACSTLARIRSLNPSLVFLVEKGGSGSSNATSRGRSSLLPPFTASLRYFAAVFDSLHECLPADSGERLAIERNYLGVEISNAMASLDHNHGGDDHMEEPSSSASWKEMMESAGFEGAKLSSRTVSQAKLLLKMKSGCGGSGGGFRVIEGDGGRAMSLGWRDSALITTTAWRRRRRSVSKTSS